MAIATDLSTDQERALRRRLAYLALELEAIVKQQADTEREIQDIVLSMGASQQVGNLKATYFNSTVVRDYAAACADAPQELVDRYSTTKTTISWAKIADAMGIRDAAPIVEEKPARVAVKLL